MSTLPEPEPIHLKDTRKATKAQQTVVTHEAHLDKLIHAAVKKGLLTNKKELTKLKTQLDRMEKVLYILQLSANAGSRQRP
jgi:hypothetical protein